MKTHTTLGTQAIKAAERYLYTSASFLKPAREIAGTHHERWDGTGYPEGISATPSRFPAGSWLWSTCTTP